MPNLLDRIRKFKEDKTNDSDLEIKLIGLGSIDYNVLNAEAIYERLYRRYEDLWSKGCQGWLSSRQDRDFEVLAKLLGLPS